MNQQPDQKIIMVKLNTRRAKMFSSSKIENKKRACSSALILVVLFLYSGVVSA